MKELHIYTSAACNYIPKVRMLFESLRKWHPEAVLHLVLADSSPESIDLTKEPFDFLHPAESLSIPNFKPWAYCHTLVELACAIKPFALKKILQVHGCKKVLYLDPDMVVYSRLDDILKTLDEHNFTLTPHLVDPDVDFKGVLDNEVCSLRHGVYNLGFIGVSNVDEVHKFADWWSARLYNFCRTETYNGFWHDQRWIDLLPCFFDKVYIERSPRHNVAPWNLTTRNLTQEADGNYLVNGEMLGFYHFTGFDSGAHLTMSEMNSKDNKVVSNLVKWYRNETNKLSKDPLSNYKWAYGFYDDGSIISKFDRFVYREDPALQLKFPDPFEISRKCFKEWLAFEGKRRYPKLFSKYSGQSEMDRLSKIISCGYVGSLDFFDLHGRSKKNIYQLLRFYFKKPNGFRDAVNKSYKYIRMNGLSAFFIKVSGR